MARDKLTIQDIRKPVGEERPLTMITAYDYTSAALADAAEVELLLVGDTAGIFIHGHESTLPVTMDDMVQHCRAVSRARPRAFVVGDLPFGSYQADPSDAVRNSIRLVQDGRCEAVKLEGGRNRVDAIQAVISAGIPVMGHVGLGPQSAHVHGGNRVQGQTAVAASAVVADAKAVADAGCFALVIEAVPARVASVITKEVPVPTIGIGAGPDCDGQVLVFHEVVGLNRGPAPRFVKTYGSAGDAIVEAIARFRSEVGDRSFPGRQHSYLMNREELAAFRALRSPVEGAGNGHQGSEPRLGSANPEHEPSGTGG